MEAFEAAVVLDLSEDRFRFYRAPASVIQPPLAGEQLFRFVPILSAFDIHANDTRALPLEALSPERTPFTFLRLIESCRTYVSKC